MLKMPVMVGSVDSLFSQETMCFFMNDINVLLSAMICHSLDCDFLRRSKKVL